MESKKEIRKRILKVRSGFTKNEIEKKSSIIIDKLIKNKYFLAEKNIMFYIDYNSEVITRNLISDCISQGKNVACPKVVSDGEMQFFKIKNLSELQEGYKGILEPAADEVYEPENALVIVPGVAFDRDGYRIGYGKGFYDRYLKKHPTYRTVALAYSCQIVDSIPREEHDIRMMEIITD